MIIERIYKYSRTQPKKAAIIINGKQVNYLDFANYIAFFRKIWVKNNLLPGSLAVVVCSDRLIGWSATLALQSLGLVTVSADKISVLNSLVLRNVSCTLMVKIPQEQVDMAALYWPDAVRLELPLAIERILIPKFFASPPGAGHILLTSGTTGTYKKIFHDASLDQIRSEARQTGEKSVINIAFLGPWTAAGYRVPFFAWACGSTVVFDSRKDWPLHLGDHDVTQVILTSGALKNATDALMQNISNSEPRWAFELIVGGGVTSASLIRLTHKLITPNLNLSFGSTEMFLPVMRIAALEQDEDFWLQPTSGRDIDIADDQGSSCKDNIEGLLRIRLQSTDYNSYIDDPETTSRVFRDGWFYPGDMAVRRADGRIRVLGRTTDVIIVRGNKIPSAALEEGLREKLGANAVCVFSGLMADNEDRVVIAVETARPIDKKICQQLAYELHKAIGNVHFVEIKAFPRTQTGMLKIDRMKLRSLIMNQRPTQH